MIRKSVRAAWRSAAVVGVAVVLAASGCKDDKEKEKEKAAETEKTATAGGAKKSKGLKDEGIDVPTEVDFEAAVESQITAATDLKKELDEIEKQIGQ